MFYNYKFIKLRVDQKRLSLGRLALAYLLLGWMLIVSYTSQAQIESMYNLYRFNPQIITPSHAGSTESSEVVFINRQQWIGIEGAPKTVAATANIKWGEKKGLGVVTMVDQAGPVKTTSFGADFAYHVSLNEKWKMSGGIRGGFSNLSLNWSSIRLVNPNDALFSQDMSTGLKFNTGWGLRFSKGDGLFVSFSQPRVFKYDFGNASGAYKDVDYFYTMMGTKVKLGNNINLYPSTLFRIAADVPLSWDINLNAQIKEKMDVGLSYRHKDSYGLRLGMQASKKIYLGYVYELPISNISKISTQTHEIALRFSFFKKEVVAPADDAPAK
ncbi:PorP/SprF family type IX secretion system membrane protein [Aquirufa rosea]|uniref:Type IX secretion system membrane protein PorP/SprF n=1 Tax=Aquirufa rosea TaxID=2509241 RepID=A0A4Q1C0I5_9BACT|nr:PorP/SprF family type IX secretion system membrane protein [Aquirufa rosea]RXK50643.1 type IX secretion system membrane protein PorP/SprF [Aquirufa rosea]